MSQISYSALSQVDPAMALRARVSSALRWLEESREWRSRRDDFNMTNMLKVQTMISRHKSILLRLEDSLINAANGLRPAVRGFRREFERLWKDNKDGPPEAMATNSRQRTVIAYGVDPGRKASYEERFWSEPRSEFELAKYGMMQSMKEKLQKVYEYEAKNSLQFRIRADAIGRDDWFLVFDTLTCDSHHYDKLWKDQVTHSAAWKRYTQKITRDVAKALGLKKGTYKQRDIHRYVAVVEAGTQHGRLHIHVLHYLKELPRGATDPNFGRRVPNYLEISTFKTYWPYGHTTPRAVRFSNSDPYARRGWRWPVERSKRNRDVYVPRRAGTIANVGNYLAKYISKDVSGINSVQKEQRWQFRTKMTHGFGKEVLRTLLDTLSLSELRKVCMEPLLIPQLRFQGHKPPMAMLKLEATRSYWKKMNSGTSKLGIAKLMEIGPQPNIFKQHSAMLDTLMRDHPSLSDEASIGTMLIQATRKTDISDLDLKRYLRMLPKVQAKIDSYFGKIVPFVAGYGPRDVR